MCDIKKEIRDRARLARGLVNGLGYDMEYLYSDAENFDLICLEESIRESKETVLKLTANLTEIEYLLYLVKKNDQEEIIMNKIGKVLTGAIVFIGGYFVGCYETKYKMFKITEDGDATNGKEQQKIESQQ